MKYLLALDQGTTSSRAILFNEKGAIAAQDGSEFPQIYPRPGWVEHDPADILDTQIAAMRGAVKRAGIDPADIAAIGIANQRETTLIWDRKTGQPIANAIVWQCRRTAPIVEQLKSDGFGSIIRDRTGLIPDAYFSGTKIAWILENTPGAQERADRGELCFGTVDSFLAWHLTKDHAHVTDATNAARTMLYDIHKGDWDDLLLRALNIPRSILPRVVNSSEIVGVTNRDLLGAEIPVAALAGDQHAALYGQACFTPGMVKNTYGTGGFMLLNTGFTPVRSQHGLITTIAWQLNGKPVYALEGSVFVAGAAVQWLRDEMQLVKTAQETEQIAFSIPDTGGVYLVPAFAGLGAPWWDMYARGTIVGLTRGSGRAQIVRATLESIAWQTGDVLNVMAQDSGLKPTVLRADGGASRNGFLMQFQADILGVTVLRPAITETTALGAAMLAGRAVGLWDEKQMSAINPPEARFTPALSGAERERRSRDWHRAVERARGWAEE